MNAQLLHQFSDVCAGSGIARDQGLAAAAFAQHEVRRLLGDDVRHVVKAHALPGAAGDDERFDGIEVMEIFIPRKAHRNRPLAQTVAHFAHLGSVERRRHLFADFARRYARLDERWHIVIDAECPYRDLAIGADVGNARMRLKRHLHLRDRIAQDIRILAEHVHGQFRLGS